MSKTLIVVLILAGVGIYTGWAICHINTLNKRMRKGGTGPRDGAGTNGGKAVREVIGKGKFVLPPRQSEPQTAVEPQTEPTEENPNIFAPGNVPEHPKQIPPEELDAVFGEAPEGVANEPLEFSAPLFVSSDFPDYDDTEPDLEENPEDDFGHLPPCATSYAQEQTLTFEQIGDTYRQVVQPNQLTDEQKQQTGEVLLGLKGTEMFGFLISSQPEGVDMVTACMDAALAAFEVASADKSGDMTPGLASAPDGFEINVYESDNKL